MKITLPRSVDGKRIAEHPLLVARRSIGRSAIARAMGLTPQTVFVWEHRAAADRDWLMPANRVRHFALAAGLPPAAFRPDVFEASWRYPDDALDGAKLADKIVEPERGRLAGSHR
jgi:hypothetical protein